MSATAMVGRLEEISPKAKNTMAIVSAV